MKIDIFNHLIPRKYYEALSKHLGKPYPAAEANPGIIDLDLRFRLMDKYDDLLQVPAPGGAHAIGKREERPPVPAAEGTGEVPTAYRPVALTRPVEERVDPHVV